MKHFRSLRRPGVLDGLVVIACIAVADWIVTRQEDQAAFVREVTDTIVGL